MSAIETRSRAMSALSVPLAGGSRRTIAVAGVATAAALALAMPAGHPLPLPAPPAPRAAAGPPARALPVLYGRDGAVLAPPAGGVSLAPREIAVAGGARLRFAGAAADARVAGAAPQLGLVNLLLGSRAHWRTGLLVYRAVAYAGLYPGVALRVEGR